MCGRYFLNASADQLAQSFAPLQNRVRLQARYNIAPTQPVPVIFEQSGRRELSFMRWGLVPSWSKSIETRFHLFNARLETLNEKPAFKAAYRYRRCILPASGFYEWRQEGQSGKQPYAIRPNDQQPLWLAGIWEHWQTAEGSELQSCCIITTAADTRMRELHERMPLMLKHSATEAWLDSYQQSTRELIPLPDEIDHRALDIYPVSRAVNQVKTDTPELLEAVPSESLF